MRGEPLDDRSAVATIVDRRVSASLVFYFARNGLLEYVRAEKRGRLVGRVAIPTPWVGRWSSWMWLNGVRVPTRGAAAWELPSGPLPYWRGGVIGITYDVAR